MPIKCLFVTEAKHLTLIGCQSLTDISNLRNVSSLDMRDCENIKTGWHALANVVDDLYIENMAIRDLPLLLAHGVGIDDTDIVDLTPLKNAKRVHISDCDNVTDISMLKNATSITLHCCSGIKDISSIKNVRSLSLMEMDVDYTCLGAQYKLDIVGIGLCIRIHDTDLNNCYKLDINCGDYTIEDIADISAMSETVRHRTIRNDIND